MPVNEKWLRTEEEEETLEPNLKICDPHHHLWQHPDSPYLTKELLKDTKTGHNVTSTVFVECMSEYHGGSTKALAPVGETEFIDRLATANTESNTHTCLLYTSPSPRDRTRSRMPSSA